MSIESLLNGTEDVESLLRRGDEDDEPKFKASWRREPYISFKETGDFAILRPLYESSEWFRARTHRFVPVSKPKPEGQEGRWPQYMSATCRKDSVLRQYFPDGCPICTSPLRTRFDKTMDEAAEDLRYTLMVEREEVIGDGSPEMGGEQFRGVKGIVDKMIDVPVFDEKGEPIKDQFVKRPSIVIVSETMYKMFGAIKAVGEAYGSLRNQDIKIKRIPNPNGKKGDIYQAIGLKEIDSIKPGTEHWQTYLDAVQAWTPDPTGLSVARVVIQKADKDHYERFFTTDGQFVLPKQAAPVSNGFAPSGGEAAPPSAPKAAPAQEVDEEKLAAMKARVMGQRTPTPES